MFKKVAIAAFVAGIVVTAAIGIVAATSTSAIPAIPSDGTSLVIQNASPLELSFSIEANGQTVPLGTNKPGQVLMTTDALVNGGLLSTLKGNEFTIHAKQPNGNEFFTLMIDRDELIQRQGGIRIPGMGGRRQAAALLGKPTTVPALTSVP